jgi:hypothetical protein
MWLTQHRYFLGHLGQFPVSEHNPLFFLRCLSFLDQPFSFVTTLTEGHTSDHAKSNSTRYVLSITLSAFIPSFTTMPDFFFLNSMLTRAPGRQVIDGRFALVRHRDSDTSSC